MYMKLDVIPEAMLIRLYKDASKKANDAAVRMNQSTTFLEARRFEREVRHHLDTARAAKAYAEAHYDYWGDAR